MDNSTAIQHIRLIINNVLNEVQPAQLFSRRITFDGKMLNILGDDYDLDQFDNIYVIGFGKASATMAAQLESILGNRIASGRVITVYEAPGECKRIHVYYGAHPVTDENGLAASLRILQTCREAGKNDLVIVLISGGGSALFEHLPPDITLADLQKLNKQMIWRGHSINEINAVRKSISLVKGGKLLNYIYPARSISLILSDVVGDHVTIIASGPTCADQSASGNPLEVLSAHHLLNMIPRSIRTRLNNVISEREIITEADEDQHINYIIGNNKDALNAAEHTALQLGYNREYIDNDLCGDVCFAAQNIVDHISALSKSSIPKPICLLAGGEITVNVQGSGIGGRNQELAVRVMDLLSKSDIRYVFASFGTDGIDGNSPAAGGIVTFETPAQLSALSIDSKLYLENNDSYHLLAMVDGLIETGATGTNVNDVAIALIH